MYHCAPWCSIKRLPVEQCCNVLHIIARSVHVKHCNISDMATSRSDNNSLSLFTIENILAERLIDNQARKIDRNKGRLIRFQYFGPTIISWDNLTLEQKKIHLFCFNEDLNKALHARQQLRYIMSPILTNSRIYRQTVCGPIRAKMQALYEWINTISETDVEVIYLFRYFAYL